MAYPHGDLAHNVLAFCDELRREHGFRLGTGEALDALRAAEAVDVGDERAFRLGLSLVCCTTPLEQEAFGGLFDAFFFPGPDGVPQHAHAELSTREDADERGSDREGDHSGRPVPEDEVGAGSPGDAAVAVEEAEEDEEVAGEMRRAPASRVAVAGAGPALSADDDAAMRAAAAHLLARLRIGRARRLVALPQGRRFDLRRTLRANLASGGELVDLRFLGRPPRHPRVVVLIDASRSMVPHLDPALRFARALAQCSLRVEVFVFSTELACVTAQLRAAGEHVLGDLGESYGGGTRIGECLTAFLRDHGERLLGPQTLVIVASDGLDVGDVGLLQEAMRTLRRRSAGVVWLNPLLETRNYEPEARAMRAALPYVTTFASASDAAGFARLAETVPLRS